MNSKTGFKRLGRRHSHRKALLRNLLQSLVERGSIVTTLAKAKEARRFADKAVEKAKRYAKASHKGIALHQLRLLARDVRRKDLLMRFCQEIGARYSQRIGGYTRIVRLSHRKGDGSRMAMLQFVEE